MEATTQEAPAVLSGVCPYLMVSDASAASDFYQKAFAAEEVNRKPADDGKRLLHVHLYINGGSLMLSDPFPDYGHPLVAPQAVTLHLQVTDADAWFGRAVGAGCEISMPVQDMFWGDRYGQLKDPFGVSWSVGAPLKTS